MTDYIYVITLSKSNGQAQTNTVWQIGMVGLLVNGIEVIAKLRLYFKT